MNADWEAVRCPCGMSGCRTWGLNHGLFQQGTGWNQETAQFVAEAVNEKIKRSQPWWVRLMRYISEPLQ